eukprot:5629349-Amphidinium_carterae.3
MSDVPGDVDRIPSMIPSMHSWRAIVLKEQQKLKMSWDDLTAAFYVFRLPSQWKRLFTLSSIGAVAIPMGWRYAVGVAQYLHRRLLLGCHRPPCLHGKLGVIGLFPFCLLLLVLIRRLGADPADAQLQTVARQ